MKTIAILVTAATLAVSGAAVSETAVAAGCVKGAVVGGVAGHFAGHHGLLGAGVGCAIGHHEAKKHEPERERQRIDRGDDPPGRDVR